MNAAAPRPPDGAFVLEAGAGGQLTARGPLTFGTARAARLAGIAAIGAAAAQPQLVLDCSQVSAADSAGLAVLIDWLAEARTAGRALRCTGLPQGLAALAHISEVTELLERGV